MDDESAEIELLEQNLNKTRQISKRMISILDSFDMRLAKLEKSILPLYTSTQILNRRASNVDKTLAKMDEAGRTQDDIVEEEALILRGPQTGQLERYKEAIERLNASIAFKSSDQDSAQTARLVETGVKKLTHIYTTLVAEVSSGSTPAPPPPTASLMASPTSPSWTTPPLPSTTLSTLRHLVSFFRTLPLPVTHPNHPAAQGVFGTLKDAQRGYADMRGVWVAKCLELQGKRVIDRVDTVDGVSSGREFGRWVEVILVVCQDEHQLLTQLVPLPPSAPTIAQSYTTLLHPILTLFSSTLLTLVTHIKKSLPKYTFLALSAFEAVLSLQARWDPIIGQTSVINGPNEFKDGLLTLRAVCLRSFPEFLADIKLGAMGKGELVSTGLTDFAISTVKYMERLPQVRAAAESALFTLGDGNWKMGEGVQVGKSNKTEEVDQSVVLEHYLYDVVVSTTTSLTTLSRNPRRPALASIFLLNNISYLRHHLLLNPVHPSLPTLLPKPAQDHLNSNFRTAKAAYFDSNFSPLMQALMDDHPNSVLTKDRSGIAGITVGGANKAATKEKFTRFFDLLEEVVERHRMAKVMEDDVVGREQLGEEVVKLVVPSLQRFSQKHRDKEFSRNPQKYIKMSAEAVETQLKSIYQ